MSSRHLVKHSSGHLQSELQLILNSVLDGLCGADAEGNATFCNDALLEMIGYRAEELVGSNLHELLHPSRGDRTKCLAAECTLRKAIHTRHPIHMAGEFLCRKDGTCFPRNIGRIPFNKHRAWRRITFRDVTEREKAAEAQRTSEERFRQISSNIDQVFYLLDVSASRVVYVSPAFQTIYRTQLSGGLCQMLPVARSGGARTSGESGGGPPAPSSRGRNQRLVPDPA
jgi:PAS domain S-box-containing protein